jgi:hypothetical protein
MERELSMQNPYETPNADLSTADEQSERLDIFKRFSTWYVFGLGTITLGLYILYWLYTRTKILNRLKGVNPIGDNFLSVTIAINVVSLPLSFAQPLLKDYGNYILIPDIVSLISTVLLLVWAFKFRHRLNNFLVEHQTPHRKAGPVFTFLFQSLHLSYKINENLDLLQQVTQAQAQSGDQSLATGDTQAPPQPDSISTATEPDFEPSSTKA